MATIVDVAEQIQTYAGSLSGIRAAPKEPPDQMNVYPFAVCGFRRGTVTIAPAGTMKLLGTFVCQIHVARKDLPRDYRVAMPFGDTFLAKILQNPTMGGKVSTVIEVRPRFVEMTYGGIETLGWDFEIDVKMQVNL